MSAAVFIDTYFLLAAANPDDAGHTRAVAWSEQFTGSLITREWVLTEFADALCQAPNRKRLVAAIDALRASPRIEIVDPDRLFEQGFELFGKRLDKDWSLTDCISFAVMQERGLTEALTADHHFEQAGFVALLKEEAK